MCLQSRKINERRVQVSVAAEISWIKIVDVVALVQKLKVHNREIPRLQGREGPDGGSGPLGGFTSLHSTSFII